MPKKLIKPDLHGQSFSNFMDEFVDESDRAAVILGAAKIEFLLGQILDKYFTPCLANTDDLLEGDAPLGTFSAKIKICHRLGLLDDVFIKLLNIFIKLRNGFAHEVTTSSLSNGAARDRVISMTDPFTESPFYQSLLHKIASVMDREINDTGVAFRTVLAVFHMELMSIHESIEPISRQFSVGIVESCKTAKAPK